MKYYRISKYNPLYRTDDGCYIKNEWTSYYDIGKCFDGEFLTRKEYINVEKRYISFLVDILGYQNIKRLSLSEIEVYNYKQPSVVEFMKKDSLNIKQVCTFIKCGLREYCWGKLMSNNFLTYVGYDYYLHIGTTLDNSIVLSLAEQNQLFVEALR